MPDLQLLAKEKVGVGRVSGDAMITAFRSTFVQRAAASAAGATGSVGVAFTLAASGWVVSQSLTRSSGNATLDGAAKAIVSALQAPPPQGRQLQRKYEYPVSVRVRRSLPSRTVASKSSRRLSLADCLRLLIVRRRSRNRASILHSFP